MGYLIGIIRDPNVQGLGESHNAPIALSLSQLLLTVGSGLRVAYLEGQGTWQAYL